MADITVESIESIFKRPPAGLNQMELAMLGSAAAEEKVKEVYPTLAMRSPAGFSPLEWARLGLRSAIEKCNRKVQ